VTPPEDRETLAALERKILWLACWMVHNANHLRDKSDDLKIGGHQASSASIATIMTALYLDILRPEDRVAVKPHASPVLHAIQYLLGNQTRQAIEDFRAYGGAQSYPSRTKDTCDVDFSTGSVGLGVAMTAFASLAQDYLIGHGIAPDRTGRMVALAGDAEFDEGNIFEALQEGYRHGLRNCWWVIDYNRQSLDAVVHRPMHRHITEVFESFGWDVKLIKHGKLQQDAFARPGGDALRDWIDACPNALYSALTYRGGAAWRDRLEADLGHNRARALVGHLDDADLARLMTNLGGHDLNALRDAFADAAQTDRPTAFIAYTIKGYGTPLAGHKDNHGGLMTPQQMDELRAAMDVREGHEWDRFEGIDAAAAQAFLDRVPFNARGTRRTEAPRIPVPDRLSKRDETHISTQLAFGKILDDIGRDRDGPLAQAIVTTSPDVTVSTGLGPWVNRRGRFASETQDDTFRTEKVPSLQKWEAGPSGQHLELGIAENNFFTMLAALGLSHELFGRRLLPIGTLYDPFVSRGLDALNYACYQDARFIVVGTPSGITLAPEGGAHQSIASPLIGMSQDGLASFEPAYADELEVMMRWAFDYMQRDPSAQTGPEEWGRDTRGGAVYLRLSTRTLEQPRRSLTAEDERAIIDGAYWLRDPGPGCELVIAYSGAVAPEAIMAAGLLSEELRDVGVLAVTSPDRLSAGWHAAARAREAGQPQARSHAERLFDGIPRHAGLVTVCDAYPATLEWLGAVNGLRTRALGVERFGQSGNIASLYAAYGIDTGAIVRAARISVGARPRALRG